MRLEVSLRRQRGLAVAMSAFNGSNLFFFCEWVVHMLTEVLFVFANLLKDIIGVLVPMSYLNSMWS